MKAYVDAFLNRFEPSHLPKVVKSCTDVCLLSFPLKGVIIDQIQIDQIIDQCQQLLSTCQINVDQLGL
jgi:hypothetical protein